MARPDEKRVWRIEVYIHATEDEASDVAERLGAAICPDAVHPGYCPVPWSIVTSRPGGKAASSWNQYLRAEKEATAKATGTT